MAMGIGIVQQAVNVVMGGNGSPSTPPPVDVSAISERMKAVEYAKSVLEKFRKERADGFVILDVEYNMYSHGARIDNENDLDAIGGILERSYARANADLEAFVASRMSKIKDRHDLIAEKESRK